MAETIDVLSWIYFVINLCLAEIVGHGLRKVWKVFPSNLYWTVRRPVVLQWTLIVTLFFLLVERNLQLFAYTLELYEPPEWLSFLLSNAFMTTLLSLYGVRAWLIHWDYCLGVAMYCQVSGQLKERNEEWYWFIAHKDTYGSPTYLLHFVGACLGGINLILLISSLVSPIVNQVVVCVVYLIIGAILVNISLKLKEIEDSFFIRDELLKEFGILAVATVVIGCFILSGHYMDWKWSFFFIIETTVIAAAMIGLLSTWWVNWRIESVSYRSKSSGNLPTFLEQPEPAIAFSRHLIKELSIENIFFLADVYQFKQWFVKAGQLDELYGFTQLVPAIFSQLSYRDNNGQDLAKWIVTRYIDGTTSFEVTCISDGTRKQIFDVIERGEKNAHNENFWIDLSQCFDDAAREVMDALQESFKRFSFSQDYKKYSG